jgi:hypothetical protein
MENDIQKWILRLERIFLYQKFISNSYDFIRCHHVDVPFGTFGGLNSNFHKQIGGFVFLDKFQNPKKTYLPPTSYPAHKHVGGVGNFVFLLLVGWLDYCFLGGGKLDYCETVPSEVGS